MVIDRGKLTQNLTLQAWTPPRPSVFPSYSVVFELHLQPEACPALSTMTRGGAFQGRTKSFAVNIFTEEGEWSTKRVE